MDTVTQQLRPTIGSIYNLATKKLTSATDSNLNVKCVCCMEENASHTQAFVQILCGCLYCTDCLSDFFEVAFSTRYSFPPRCCGMKLSIHKFAQVLPPDKARAFLDVLEEYTAEQPVYCAGTGCGHFIKDSLIEGTIGICITCLRQTCLKCSNLVDEHIRGICGGNRADAEIKALARRKGWIDCPKCHRTIEKIDGCLHITCTCNQDFCYKCGEAYEPEPVCACGTGIQGDESEDSGDDDSTGNLDDESDESEDDILPERVLLCTHATMYSLTRDDDLIQCHGCFALVEGANRCRTCLVELCMDCWPMNTLE